MLPVTNDTLYGEILAPLPKGPRSQDGTYGIGDLVTRNGSDVKIVISMTEDGFTAEFKTLVEDIPNEGCVAIYPVGEVDNNLCRRYSLIEDDEYPAWSRVPEEYRHLLRRT